MTMDLDHDARPLVVVIEDEDEPAYADAELLYIDPVECIDCGACVPVCPVSAIFALDDLPEKWSEFTAKNDEAGSDVMKNQKAWMTDLKAFLDAVALPSGVRGPVARSHGFQVRISSAWVSFTVMRSAL